MLIWISSHSKQSFAAPFSKRRHRTRKPIMIQNKTRIFSATVRLFCTGPGIWLLPSTTPPLLVVSCNPVQTINACCQQLHPPPTRPRKYIIQLIVCPLVYMQRSMCCPENHKWGLWASTSCQTWIVKSIRSNAISCLLDRSPGRVWGRPQKTRASIEIGRAPVKYFYLISTNVARAKNETRVFDRHSDWQSWYTIMMVLMIMGCSLFNAKVFDNLARRYAVKRKLWRHYSDVSFFLRSCQYSYEGEAET